MDRFSCPSLLKPSSLLIPFLGALSYALLARRIGVGWAIISSALISTAASAFYICNAVDAESDSPHRWIFLVPSGYDFDDRTIRRLYRSRGLQCKPGQPSPGHRPTPPSRPNECNDEIPSLGNSPTRWTLWRDSSSSGWCETYNPLHSCRRNTLVPMGATLTGQKSQDDT